MKINPGDIRQRPSDAEPGGGGKDLDEALAVPPLIVIPVQDSLLPPLSLPPLKL